MAQTNGKRKPTVLPLHIDTTSFTNPPPQGAFTWRRYKRQLPLLILLCLFILSVSANFVQRGRHRNYYNQIQRQQSPSTDPLPPPPHHHLDVNHAIIVAGHAIYKGTPDPQHIATEPDWILEPYQQGQVDTFVKHIQKGVDLAQSDPHSLLIFSG